MLNFFFFDTAQYCATLKIEWKALLLFLGIIPKTFSEHFNVKLPYTRVCYDYCERKQVIQGMFPPMNLLCNKT